MSAQNHVLDQISGYVLDCLSEQEMLLVSEHLAGCATCSAEMHAYRKVVDNLYLATPQHSPPPELKHTLMRSIAASRLPARPAAKKEKAARSVGWPLRFAPLFALASLVVLILMIATNLWLAQRVRQLEAASKSEFGLVALAGTDAAPGASGMLVLSHDGNLGTLVVDGLAPLESSKQYQLWLIHDNKRDSGGVFSVTSDGYGALTVASAQPLKNYSAFGITVEPAGGSPGPTGKKVLGGKAPAGFNAPPAAPPTP
jgi:anti-sigma-K factor RskA